MANYAKCQILCNLLFAMFAILFISSRLGVYPIWWVLFASLLCTIVSILLKPGFSAGVLAFCVCMHVLTRLAERFFFLKQMPELLCLFWQFISENLAIKISMAFFFSFFLHNSLQFRQNLFEFVLLSNSYYGYHSFKLSKKAKHISKWKADHYGYWFIFENCV